MSNITITNVDGSSVVYGDAEYRDDILKFTGADTYVDGTILARDSSDNKLIAFVKGGAVNDNGIPKAILVGDVTVTGAGDVPIRPLLKGNVRKEKLVIDADGDASNVDNVVIDEMRDYAIVALDVQELNKLDNQ